MVASLRFAALPLLTACNALIHDERPVPDDVSQVAVTREALVAAMLPYVDANGQLQFPLPELAQGELPGDSVRSVAHEYLFYALNTATRAVAESQRGAFIDLGRLSPCNRVQLLRSVFDAPPDSALRPLQFALGDHWHVPFCGARSTPEVVVSVATRRNDVRYRDGRLVGTPEATLGAYAVVGIYWAWQVEHVFTAEEAVNAAYDLTGIKVAAHPELATLNRLDEVAQSRPLWCPLWRITFNAPVRIVTSISLRRLSLSELYVSSSSCNGIQSVPVVMTPAAAQPASASMSASVSDPTAPNGVRRQTFLASYRRPVVFESVAIERP